MNSKEKAKDSLPLKGLVKTKQNSDFLKKEKTKKLSKQGFSNLEDVIGTRKARRECAVGVRVTREMKEVLESLAMKTRLSESEIVFRILQKSLEEETAG